MELFHKEILPTLSPNNLINLEKKLFAQYTKETAIPDFFQNTRSP